MEQIVDRFEKMIDSKEVSEQRLTKLKELSDTLDETHRTQVTDILDTLNAGKLKKAQLTKLQSFIESTKQVVNKDVNSSYIEEKLDENVKKYILSEETPMCNVKFNKKTEKYVGKYDGHTFSSRELSIVCQKMLNAIREAYNTTMTELTDVSKIGFTYNKKNMLVFGYKGNAFFDIQHIFQLLDLKESTLARKYTEFFDKIKYYTVEKNQFGGYFIRELVTEEVAYEIIMSSRSTFSKLFKSCVSQIIVEARRDGKLVADTQTGQIAYNKDMKLIEQPLNAIQCVYCIRIGLVYDLKEPMELNDDLDDKDYVIKFGMTDNLVEELDIYKQLHKKMKLKYYVWIDDMFSSDVESEMKKYFKDFTIFEHDHSPNFGIMTKQELHDVKDFYTTLNVKYSSKFRSIVDKYKKDINKLKHKVKLQRKDYECQLEKLKTEHALQLLKLETEKNALLQNIVELKNVKSKNKKMTI